MDKDHVKMELKHLYDGAAEYIGDAYQSIPGRHYLTRVLKTAFFLGQFPSNGRILDLGCANGAYAFELVKHNFHVVGIDMSPRCIEIATQRKEGIEGDIAEFVIGDAEDLLGIESNSFDGVVSFSCLRFTVHPANAMSEIFRVLKPGARAVVDFPNRYSPWFYCINRMVSKGRVHPHDNYFSTKEAVNQFRQAGFINIKVRRILYIHKFIPIWLFPICRVFEVIGELPLLNHFATIIMIGAEKSRLAKL